uniref:Uncharacterized protein n=1 Tax=Aegilops tauschii subsp. strangulata TaxID=200361 RepID=A0A453DXD7_AEGTS
MGWLRAKKCGVTDEVEEDLHKVWAGGQGPAGWAVEPLRPCMDGAREITSCCRILHSGGRLRKTTPSKGMEFILQPIKWF